MHAFYFTAPWCVPCKTFGPVMEQVTAIPVDKVDVDLNPEMTNLYGVMSVPTVIVVDKNDFELGRITGAKSLEAVNAFIATFK